MPRISILLKALLLSLTWSRSVVADTSTTLHHRSSLSSSSSNINAITRWPRRRSIAFMAVPRGGGIIDENEECSPTEEEEKEEKLDNENNDDDDLSADEDAPEPREPSRFSLALPLSSSAAFTSSVARYATILLRVATRAYTAGARAIFSERDDDDNEEGEVEPVVHTSLLGRTAYVLGEVYHAVLTPEDQAENNSGTVEEQSSGSGSGEVEGEPHNRRRGGRRRRRRRKRSRSRHTTAPTEIVCNGGGMDPTTDTNTHAIQQLAKQFDIDLSAACDESNQPSKKYTDSILLGTQTSLNEALQKANGNARFLICYISKKSNNADAIAMPNLISPEFIKLANRRPLGKKQAGDSGSYYVWLANGNDGKDAEGAMRRLKLKPPASRSKSSGSKKKSKKSNGNNAPILAIVYPATTIDPSNGKLKVTPKVLAQHHCHPPPSTPDALKAWVNTLRKRHLREFAKLQHDVKEMQLMRERTQGYVSSMKEDTVREEKSERELQLKREEEERERLRKEKMEERRAQLLEDLEEEPEVGAEGVISIALRFSDSSKRDQRRFIAGDTYTNDVFDWIDAVHGLEREKIELSTMNGSKTFRYVEEECEEDGEEDVTLEEVGLGRMTALRVTEIVVDEEEDGGEEEDGESEYDEESDED